MQLIRFSIQIETHLGYDWSTVRRIAEEAEKLGYYALYICDHLLGRTEELSKKPNLECWTTLASLSATTTRLRLGTLVNAVGFRSPALLAKIASTFDVISQGRLQFGVGAGWYEPEYKAYGFPFPKTPARIEQLAESIQIIRKMWTEDEATFEGKHFAIRNAICNPKPTQKPHPPIWIGGTGKRVLQLVAKEADGWNSIGLTSEEYKEKLQILSQECQRHNRDPANIRRSIYTGVIVGRSETELQNILQALAPRYKRAEESNEEYRKRIRSDGRRLVGLPSKIIARIHAYEDLGVEEIICFFPDLPDLTLLRTFSQEILQTMASPKYNT